MARDFFDGLAETRGLYLLTADFCAFTKVVLENGVEWMTFEAGMLMVDSSACSTMWLWLLRVGDTWFEPVGDSTSFFLIWSS